MLDISVGPCPDLLTTLAHPAPCTCWGRLAAPQGFLPLRLICIGQWEAPSETRGSRSEVRIIDPRPSSSSAPDQGLSPVVSPGPCCCSLPCRSRELTAPQQCCPSFSGCPDPCALPVHAVSSVTPGRALSGSLLLENDRSVLQTRGRLAFKEPSHTCERGTKLVTAREAAFSTQYVWTS